MDQIEINNVQKFQDEIKVFKDCEMSELFVRMAPKVELHAHLSGCVRKSTLIEFANKKGINIESSWFDQRDNTGQFHLFDLISKSICTLKELQRVTQEVLIDFQNQGVVYLELRTTPKDCKQATYTSEEYLQTVLDVVNEFNQSYGWNSKNVIDNSGQHAERKLSGKITDCYDQHEEININKQQKCGVDINAQGKSGTQQISVGKMECRIIVSIDRGRSVNQAKRTFDQFQRFRKNYSILVGIDFGGNPELNSFSDFIEILKECKKKGVNLTVHTGVISGEKTLAESREIIEFQPERVGHFNFFDSALLNSLIEKKIPVEICPTSNYFTKGLTNMTDHHFKYLFFTAHTVSLSTDDTCVFDTNSTLEHINIIQAFSLTKQHFHQLLLLAANMIFDISLKLQLTQIISQYFMQSQF